ncbi:(Fe-S)-binding protein [Clostridium saccharoperbutylacetonicum]|nr:(Fe-S)-binding protein [Clostridium saccharoperbutylacetonicum]AQR97493.1 anaerobic glycerol-3-phosphate dehydrogenase subunit C [Clostridium saccharoperbutylacetonicum]NSB33377.1 Fe-S oxidoreductase [Clostridium saccharoperbutylacetonicum]
MALRDYERDSQKCIRCSYCKWIPFENQQDAEFTVGCPASKKYGFHAYSAGGKFNMALSLLNERIETKDVVDPVYKCMMDGLCDVSCKVLFDIEPLQCMQELRIKCVEEGHGNPAHMRVIEGLNKEANMMQRSSKKRGNWADGLAVKDLSKEKAEVLYHAGCRYSFDEELRPTVRAGLSILLDAGVDVGIMGRKEICCGGRAYEMGYVDEFTKFAEGNLKILKAAGVKTIVTPCSDCYQSFKVLYDKKGKKIDIEVLHITEYLHQLIKEGKIKLTKEVPLTVTYHDPCHLGRLAEPWVHWQGKEVKVLNHVTVHEPPKKFRRGVNGVYDIPREILQSIPGVKLVEMYRNRESAWCCGAGGGVKDAYPDFAIETAAERLKEAKAVGAKAIVSACPWCIRNFTDASRETGKNIEIYDIIDLVRKAI